MARLSFFCPLCLSRFEPPWVPVDRVLMSCQPSAPRLRGSALQVGLLLVALLVPAVLAAPAQAEQPSAPRLTGTTPGSPSTALRPLIRGTAEEVIVSGIDPSDVMTMSAVGPITMATKHPNFEITIYTSKPLCEAGGVPAAKGTAGELEGVGIQVDANVEEDAVTTFFAKQTDPSDPLSPSACSNGLAYRQVTTPPGEPTLLGVTPSSPANDNFPNLTGTSDSEAIVSIYDDPDCEGAVRGQGTGAEFAGAGIQVSVADNSTATFYAQATLGGLPSPCSTTSVTYQEVSPPPEDPGPGGGEEGGGSAPPSKPPIPDVPGKPQPPKLHVTPNGPANDNTPRVTGSAPGAVTVKIFGNAECKGSVLTQGSAADLAAGFSLQVPNDTVVTFYGVTIDSGGDRSACSPEPAVYIEDSTAPRTRITAGPGVKTSKRKVIFRFADINGDVATSFICKIDKRKWKPCQAPFRLRKLKRRRHVVRVKGVDAAGNREARGAKRSFKIIGRRR
jgi:hypothetical protein